MKRFSLVSIGWSCVGSVWWSCRGHYGLLFAESLFRSIPQFPHPLRAVRPVTKAFWSVGKFGTCKPAVVGWMIIRFHPSSTQISVIKNAWDMTPLIHLWIFPNFTQAVGNENVERAFIRVDPCNHSRAVRPKDRRRDLEPKHPLRKQSQSQPYQAISNSSFRMILFFIWVCLPIAVINQIMIVPSDRRTRRYGGSVSKLRRVREHVQLNNIARSRSNTPWNSKFLDVTKTLSRNPNVLAVLQMEPRPSRRQFAIFHVGLSLQWTGPARKPKGRKP